MKTFGTDNAHWSKVSRRGGALVVSLVFIILITIVLVGFVTTAGLERSTVQSHYGRIQSDLFSAMAVDVVASRITMATGQTNSWWISQPGRIALTPFVNGSATPTTTFYDLHSGAVDTNAQVDPNVWVNLNPASLTQGTGVVVGDAAVTLPVKWIYIRKDGTQDVAGSAAPAYDKDNPWVGRYAYWADDESARINVNTATSRLTPENETATHPSRLDLTELGSLTAADIQEIREARDKRTFNSVEEVNAASATLDPTATLRLAATLRTEKQALTHFSHSPDLNRFGEPRIVLTTQANLAGGQPFFDILNAPNSDPGEYANLDEAKIVTLFEKLYPYFSKRACDWGLVYPAQGNYWNKTFIDRYGTGSTGARFAAGIILNIIDYVRSVESSQPLILPLRGAFNSSSGTLTLGVSGYGATGNYGPNALRGNSRRQHIVEMGIWLPSTPVAGKFQGKLKVRIYLPPYVGQAINLSTQGLALQAVVRSSSSGNYLNSTFVITGTHLSEADPMQPGQYRTITYNFDLTAATRPTQAYMRLALRQGATGTSYDFAPLEQSETLNKYALYNIDPPGVSEADMTSLSTDDPAVNQSCYDWKQGDNTRKNKFGTQDPTPESTLGLTVPAGIPQQDGDVSGNLTNVSTQLPAPKGTAANPAGLIGSVGDLGRIHSGIAGTSVTGKPWRTLRLQPRFAPNGSLPDWIILDLFTAPLRPKSPADSSDEAVLRPTLDARGGLVNLNENVYPFASTQIVRNQSLRAVIKAVEPSTTPSEVDARITEIVGYNGTSSTLASGSMTTGLAFGTTAISSVGIYPMPGQLCEVKGIADGGEESEAFVRGLLGFLTTRSNVFSVFSVGEKIQQLPNGTIKVMGTTRTRTLLERYNDGGTWKVRSLSTTELGI